MVEFLFFYRLHAAHFNGECVKKSVCVKFFCVCEKLCVGGSKSAEVGRWWLRLSAKAGNFNYINRFIYLHEIAKKKCSD